MWQNIELERFLIKDRSTHKKGETSQYFIEDEGNVDDEINHIKLIFSKVNFSHR